MRIVLICCLCIVCQYCTKDAAVPTGTGSLYKVSTSDVTSITQTGAIITASVSGTAASAKLSSKGICYSTSPLPVVTNLGTSGTASTGFYTVTLTNLLAGKKYYVRAFAIVANSMALYGNEMTFTTLPVNPPTVVSYGLTSIGRNTAVFSSYISSAGGGTLTARGVCWSTAATPTISNSFTVDGAATGTYSSSLTGLSAATTYYARAYATNEAGTSYGSVYSFKTLN